MTFNQIKTLYNGFQQQVARELEKSITYDMAFAFVFKTALVFIRESYQVVTFFFSPFTPILPHRREVTAIQTSAREHTEQSIIHSSLPRVTLHHKLLSKLPGNFSDIHNETHINFPIKVLFFQELEKKRNILCPRHDAKQQKRKLLNF